MRLNFTSKKNIYIYIYKYIYKMDTQSYKDLQQNNSTKTYKKVYPDTAVVYYVET